MSFGFSPKPLCVFLGFGCLTFVQEMLDWYQNSNAASSERAGHSTVDPTSEGELPESFPPATPGEHLSDGEMSELFDDERN